MTDSNSESIKASVLRSILWDSTSVKSRVNMFNFLEEEKSKTNLRACDTWESSKFYWFSVSACLCPKYLKFCFWNLRNIREDKNGMSEMKNVQFLQNLTGHFFIIKTKSSLFLSIFNFSIISLNFENKILCTFDTKM